MTEHSLHDDVVLIRTHAGQHAVFDDLDLDEPGSRLLRLVNGFTPFAGLSGRLDPRSDWKAAARTLLERRLIRVHGRPGEEGVPPSPPH